ncbi:transcription factor HES-5-like [Gastrophryne carolinensis]
MAPCAMTTLDHQASNGLRKLRKPVIEKMRRDRINSSIEQLRVLLEKEFQKHQLPSKPEKADILEMTVALLQQRMAEKNMTTSSSQAHRDGYTACVRDSMTFLSLHTPTEVQLQLVKNLPGGQNVTGSPCSSTFPLYQTFDKQAPLDSNKAMWRPW